MKKLQHQLWCEPAAWPMPYARRKFHDALKLDPQDKDAVGVLAIMGKLYAVEKEALEIEGFILRTQKVTRADKSPYNRGIEGPD